MPGGAGGRVFLFGAERYGVKRADPPSIFCHCLEEGNFITDITYNFASTVPKCKTDIYLEWKRGKNSC